MLDDINCFLNIKTSQALNNDALIRLILNQEVHQPLMDVGVIAANLKKAPDGIFNKIRIRIVKTSC
ncbi:hypothetical protein KR100_03670 [Synechococcus sp. KORDI-100]|nr:hypothetical protein KR100_03670 [Synechococcus sp. KORDI-100]